MSRILHIVNEPPTAFHGGTTHIRAVDTGLERLGHSIVSLAPSDNKKESVSFLGGIKTYQLPINPRWFPYRLPLLYWKRLKDIIQKEKIDFVIERYTPLGGAGILTAHKLKIPCILEVNSPGIEAEYALGKIGKVSKKVLSMYRKKLMTLATGMKVDSFACVPHKELHKKVRDIHYGADTKIFSAKLAPHPNKKLTLVFVSGFQKWHGARTIVEAARSLQMTDYRDRYKYMLIGNGPEKEAVMAEVKKYGLNRLFSFPGSIPVQYLPNYLALADIALAPFDLTDWEKVITKHGFFFRPIKIYEYMAMGLPIITVDTPSIRDLVRDKKEALLIPWKRNAMDLHQAIITLTEDRKLRTKLGKEARKRIIKEGWTWENHVKKLDTLIQECIRWNKE